jgi:ADP-ribose pyrophosphatase
MPPEILDSRTAFETPWLRLRMDRLRLADGMEIDYGYITRPRYAIIAAVQDGHVWLVEQYRHPLGARSIELPMGIAPGGDSTPIEEAAAIELREETGLRAERFDYVGEIAPAPALLAQTGALFLATGLTEGATDLEPTEQDLVARPWSIEDAVAGVLDGRIRDGATVASFGLLRMKELI